MRVLEPKWDDVVERMTACHCNQGGCAQCEGLGPEPEPEPEPENLDPMSYEEGHQ